MLNQQVQNACKKKFDTEEAKRLALADQGDLFDNYFLPTAKALEDALISEDAGKMQKSLAKLNPSTVID